MPALPDDMPLNEIKGLDRRAVNVLQDVVPSNNYGRIWDNPTVGQIRQLHDSELLRTPNCGKKTVIQIRSVLAGTWGRPPVTIEEAFRAGFKAAVGYCNFLGEHGNDAEYDWAEETGLKMFLQKEKIS